MIIVWLLCYCVIHVMVTRYVCLYDQCVVTMFLCNTPGGHYIMCLYDHVIMYVSV